MAARAAFRNFPACGPHLQPWQERMLEMLVRSDEMESAGQGFPRPQGGALRRRFAARRHYAWRERRRPRRDRDRQGHRQRFPHRPASAHCEPRHDGLDNRPALYAGAAAMPMLRERRTARSGPNARAHRAARRRQDRHHERRLQIGGAGRYGRPQSQACEPADRSRFASRADQERATARRQLHRKTQFFPASRDRRRPSGRAGRR